MLRHLVNTVNISSVALSLWMRNVFRRLHIDETTIGPQKPSVEVTISVMYDVVVFVMCAMY